VKKRQRPPTRQAKGRIPWEGIDWPFGGWLAELAAHQTIRYPSMYQPGTNQYKPPEELVRMHPTIRHDGHRQGRSPVGFLSLFLKSSPILPAVASTMVCPQKLCRPVTQPPAGSLPRAGVSASPTPRHFCVRTPF
jgi:hypothetical protein